MKIVRCDRCGAEIEKCPELKIKVDVIQERRGSCYTSSRLDLCQDCEDAVYHFILKKGPKSGANT